MTAAWTQSWSSNTCCFTLCSAAQKEMHFKPTIRRTAITIRRTTVHTYCVCNSDSEDAGYLFGSVNFLEEGRNINVGISICDENDSSRCVRSACRKYLTVHNGECTCRVRFSAINGHCFDVRSHLLWRVEAVEVELQLCLISEPYKRSPRQTRTNFERGNNLYDEVQHALPIGITSFSLNDWRWLVQNENNISHSRTRCGQTAQSDQYYS